MTVRELLATTTSRELSEWIVFINMEWWKEHLAKKARESSVPSPELIISSLFRGASKGGK